MRKIYLETNFKIQQIGMEDTKDPLGIHSFIHFISDIFRGSMEGNKTDRIQKIVIVFMELPV